MLSPTFPISPPLHYYLCGIFTSYNPPFCSLLFNFLSIPFFQLFLSSPLYSSPIHTLSSLLTPLEMDKCYLHKHNLINLTLNKPCIVMVDIFFSSLCPSQHLLLIFNFPSEVGGLLTAAVILMKVFLAQMGRWWYISNLGWCGTCKNSSKWQYCLSWLEVEGLWGATMPFLDCNWWSCIIIGRIHCRSLNALWFLNKLTLFGVLTKGFFSDPYCCVTSRVNGLSWDKSELTDHIWLQLLCACGKGNECLKDQACRIVREWWCQVSCCNSLVLV